MPGDRSLFAVQRPCGGVVDGWTHNLPVAGSSPARPTRGFDTWPLPSYGHPLTVVPVPPQVIAGLAARAQPPHMTSRTMASPPEPSPSGDTATTAALAVQVAALRGQVRLIFARLEQAGLTGDLNLADRLTELARTVTQSVDSPPRGPAAPYWIGLDPAEHAAQLAGLRQWADTVLRREYGGYQLPACWANHPHAVWELSTLAAE
jgi:hypothetical protein